MHPALLLVIIHLVWIFNIVKFKRIKKVYLILTIGIYDFVNYLLFKLVMNASTHGNTVHGWYSKYNETEKLISYLWFILFPLVVYGLYFFLIELKENKNDNSGK